MNGIENEQLRCAWVRASLFLAAAVLMLAVVSGCGEGNGGASEPEDDSAYWQVTEWENLPCPVESVQEDENGEAVLAIGAQVGALDTGELIGKTVDEANELASAHGCEVVVIVEDKEPGTQIGVPDPTHIQVEAEDDRIKTIFFVGEFPGREAY